MSATDHLSDHQFVDIPVEQVHGFPLHEDHMDPEWHAEHANEYKEHGGIQGYVSHLAGSMKQHGQKEPVELRREAEDAYSIWDGNHRVAALREAGATHVRARLIE